MRRETVSNRPGVNRLRYEPVFSLRNKILLSWGLVRVLERFEILW